MCFSLVYAIPNIHMMILSSSFTTQMQYSYKKKSFTSLNSLYTTMSLTTNAYTFKCTEEKKDLFNFRVLFSLAIETRMLNVNMNH